MSISGLSSGSRTPGGIDWYDYKSGIDWYDFELAQAIDWYDCKPA